MKNESKEIKFTNAGNDHHIGFFERIKRSIFNVEKYGEFLLEKTRVSIKYFFLLTFIISVILSAVNTYHIAILVNKAFNYIKYEIPNFTYENGILNFESYAEGYDKDNDFYDIIDTNPEITDEAVESHIKKIKNYKAGIIFLSNEIILNQDGQLSEYTYEHNVMEVSQIDKEGLVNLIDTMGIQGVAITYFIAGVLATYLTNLIYYFADILMVCVFGYLVSRIVGIPLNLAKTLSLSIYSMTLSLILSMLYLVVYSFTDFVIEYFAVMYLIVAYIYIIAAILIIKSDLLKQQVELQKIYKVEAKVKKELEEQKNKDEEKDKEKEDKKDEKKKEKEDEEDEPLVGREPDGSEI